MPRYGTASRPAEPRTPISRDAAATPGKRTLTEALSGDAPAFTPRVTVTPPAVPLLLGGTAAIGFELQNAKELPAGARLEWLPVVDGVTLETAGVTSADRPSTALKVHATAPGRDTPTALLNVYDKTGELLATLGEAPDLTIPAPVGTWEFERHGADGSKSPDVTRVTVGDKLHTRLTLDQVDAAIQSLGPPLGGYSPADCLTMDAGQWTAAVVFERDLSAIKIGATEGQLTWRTAKMEPADALSTKIKTNVEMPKAEWDTALRLARDQVQIEFLSLGMYVRSMANAYATAYKNHGDVLKDQAEFNKLIGDAVIGAILAFTTGGLGGAVNKAMDALSAGKFLVEGVTDLSKFGAFPAQKASDGAQGTAAQAGGLTAMPADPLRWQNEFHNRVDAEHRAVLKAILDWDTRASKHDPAFFRNFDPQQAVASSLVLAGKQLSQLTPLEPEAAALEFERRMWQKWLDRYAFRLAKYTKTTSPTLTDPMGPSAEKIEISYDVEERTPDKIKNRCARIGLDYAKYAGGIKQRYEAEADRRNKDLVTNGGPFRGDPYDDDD